MAQPPRAAGNGDNFVRHVVADPKNVPDVMLLYGYPGASSEEGHERLYLSPDLSSYVEIPHAAVLHRAESGQEQDPLRGVTLWVKKDAALKYRMAPAQQAAQQALANYFAGALAGAGVAPGAGMAAAPPVGMAFQAGKNTRYPRCQWAEVGPTGHLQCGQAQAAAPAAPMLPRSPYDGCQPVTLAQALCPISQAAPCATRYVTCLPHATCGATCVETCYGTCAATCGATCAATCQAEATCGATCVATCNATCAIGCTGHVTCAPVCTHFTPCVTRGAPDCPFPTEICTHVAAQCTHALNCPLPQAAQAGMGAAAQAACALGTIAASVQIACSIACPTRFVTCTPECWVTRYITCNCTPDCVITRYWTCNIECVLTRIPDLCPIASGVACPPPQSIACGGSVGCGVGPGPGPVEQAAFRGTAGYPCSYLCTYGVVCRTPGCPM